jgi:hypothetical protein
MSIKLAKTKLLGKAGTQLVSVWLFCWLFVDLIIWYLQALTGAY